MNKKTNILIPIAGKGQRFVDEGYVMPKQLITVGDTQMIDRSLSSIINKDKCNLIFCVRRDHINDFSLDTILKKRYGEDIKIIIIDKLTRGSVETCLYAKKYINNDDPLVIYTLDVCFEPHFNPLEIDNNVDGSILTFKSNNNNYSYAKVNKEGYVSATAEKEVISENAAVGVYTFSRGSNFVTHAEQMINKNITTKNEFYICPLYNLMIEAGLKIKTHPVEKMHLMGTPSELEFFLTHTLVKFGDKPLAICADHSGFHFKETIRTILDSNNINYIDYGTFVDKDCDYNDYVAQAVSAVKRGDCDYIIASCRTGQGVNIAGNKFTGIRAAIVHDEYTAEYAVRHNCANLFSIPSKYVDKKCFEGILKTWETATFDGGRHITRITKAEKNESVRS